MVENSFVLSKIATIKHRCVALFYVRFSAEQFIDALRNVSVAHLEVLMLADFKSALSVVRHALRNMSNSVGSNDFFLRLAWLLLFCLSCVALLYVRFSTQHFDHQEKSPEQQNSIT